MRTPTWTSSELLQNLMRQVAPRRGNGRDIRESQINRQSFSIFSSARSRARLRFGLGDASTDLPVVLGRRPADAAFEGRREDEGILVTHFGCDRGDFARRVSKQLSGSMHAEPDELLSWGATEFAEAESFELLFAQVDRSRHVSTGPGFGKSFADLLPETPDAFIASFGFIEAACVAGCQIAPAFDFDSGTLVSALVMKAFDRKS